MKKRLIAKLTALAIAAGMLPLTPVHAEETSASDYGAGDGISISELAGGNIFFGQMKHPLHLGSNSFSSYYGAVTKTEETATPILWDVMGEEQDADGNGDGKLTVLSKYIIGSEYFNSDAESTNNDYINSNISSWLNDSESGFLKDTFTASENSAVPVTDVVCDDGTVSQKVYIPWGTTSSNTDTFPSVYWSAGKTEGKNLIADSLKEQGATLKGALSEVRYWLRSHGNAGYAHVVDRTSTSNASNAQYPRVFNQIVLQGAYNQLGVRPVTKINLDDIVFASEIVSEPSDFTQTAVVMPYLTSGDEVTPNYKLTILGNNGGTNPYSMNVSNYAENAVIPVTKGDTIDFSVDNISNYGDDYTINYKAVMTVNDKRTIIAGGQTDALTTDTASLSVSSDDFLRTESDYDTIDLYLWLQKNNDSSSNEASEPIHFEIKLTGGEPSAMPTPEPEQLSAEVKETIKLSYPDGKKKAVILSFDDLADYHMLADLHLDEILDTYGLKAAFHAITSLVADGGLVKNKLSELDGHEISSHSVNHLHLDEITTEEFISELQDSKTFIEELTGKKTPGLAYPYYYTADPKHLQYIKNIGYRYSRRTDPTNSFDIPSSFYNWNPTMWALWKGPDNADYVLPSRTQDFIDLQTDEEKLMFIWGHSTDFGNFNTESESYDESSDNWYIIEDFCKSISENLGTIWNPTVIDYVDYINAQKLLGIYKGSGDNILFDNTKSDKDVWVTVSDVPVMIAAGQSIETDPSELDIPASPTASPTAEPTATPTAEPTATPTAEPTATPTVKPAATAAPQSSDVMMVCDFENNAMLSVTSSGAATAEKVTSPMGSSYTKITNAGSYDETSAAANASEYQTKVLDSDKNNTVLKLSQQSSTDKNTVTIYEGKLPQDFALDFSVLGIDTYANIDLSISQGDTSCKVMRTVGSSEYPANSDQRLVVNSASTWTPHSFIFKDFATDNTKLDIYYGGRYNYSPAAANPQTYDSASFDFGDYYKAIDLSEDVKIELSTTSASAIDMYFDNIRIYAVNQTVSNEAANNFENDTLSMLPMQNGIRTGGTVARQWAYVDTAGTKKYFGLWSYSTLVTADPLNSSNKVLKGTNGAGLNEYYHDKAVRFTVNKPKETLTLKFKVLTSSETPNFTIDIADGTFKDIFFANITTTMTYGDTTVPADRIMNIAKLSDTRGQFTSSGRYPYPARYTDDGLDWVSGEWNDVTLVYDVASNTTAFNINDNEFTITPNPNSEKLSEIMASDEKTVTIALFQPVPSGNSYIMLDDISIVSDDGNTEADPTPTAEPSATPTAEPDPTDEPSATPTAEPTATPTVTPTAEPSPAPTEEPDFDGEWKSEFYADGTGYNDTLQYPSYVKDLGEAKTVNKIKLNHDSAKILSFSLSVSENGTDYTVITPVYAGGVEKNSGEQIYRFAAQNVRYIKYSPVLLGEHTTQARVYSMECTNTETVSMIFSGLPDEVNPVEKRHDIPISVTVTDSDGDTYTVSEAGAAYESADISDSVFITGNVLSITRGAVSGSVTLTAKDLSNDTAVSHEIKIKAHAAIRNFGLYADESCTESISGLAPNQTVYAKAEALTSEVLGTVNINAVFALYNADGTLAGIGIYNTDVTSSSAYADITASYTLPETVNDGMYLTAYIWDNDNYPLSDSVIYSDNAEIPGFADAQLFVNKSESSQIRLSQAPEEIVWESSDTAVASVDPNGNITGTGEGTAIITAKNGDEIIDTVSVDVEPVNVFLCMGQSNMSAMTTIASDEKDPVDVSSVSEGVLLLNKDNEFEQAEHSYGRHTGVKNLTTGYSDATTLLTPGRINMTYSFAEDFKNDNPGSKIGLIVNACCGTAISVFTKDSSDGNGFENSVERALSDAVQHQGELKGILWHQGESNGSDANYGYVFKNVMYDFKTALGNLELPVIAGGLAEDKPISGTNTSAVTFNDNLNAETANMADFGFASSRTPYVLTVNATDSTNENKLADESHFSAKSQVEFGHRYYNEFLKISVK